VVCSAATEMPKPLVRMVEVPKAYNAPPPLSRRETNDALVINILAKMSARTWRITQETLKALKAPGGRKILVLSERLEHVRTLEHQLQQELRKDPELTAAGVTTGFYVGEWFTGEQTRRLRPKEWPLEGSDREEAIKAVYLSISRRKGYSGRIERKGQTKWHIVRLPRNDWWGCGIDAEGHGEKVTGGYELALEMVPGDSLYELAKNFRICQKKKEKKRSLTEQELFDVERARVIYATYQMVAEGVDLPAVDTLGLATPISDVEQAVGRVRRFCVPDPAWPEKCAHFCAWRAEMCQGKAQPVVFDIVDQGYPLPAKRERWRQEWYWNNGFKLARGR
jgi:hypothetical protein